MRWRYHYHTALQQIIFIIINIKLSVLSWVDISVSLNQKKIRKMKFLWYELFERRYWILESEEVNSTKKYQKSIQLLYLKSLLFICVCLKSESNECTSGCSTTDWLTDGRREEYTRGNTKYLIWLEKNNQKSFLFLPSYSHCHTFHSFIHIYSSNHEYVNSRRVSTSQLGNLTSSFSE